MGNKRHGIHVGQSYDVLGKTGNRKQFVKTRHVTPQREAGSRLRTCRMRNARDGGRLSVFVVDRIQFCCTCEGYFEQAAQSQCPG